jgi:hypothetical protein
MSSSPDFKTALIESSIISDITDQETFGVLAGPALSTYTQFQAISASSSQIVFNIQVPSEAIVINREVYMASDVAFTITGGNVPNVGDTFLNWGLTEALNAFPLQSLMTTIQAQINNVSTSTNLQDVLPELLRMNDPRKLSAYNSMTPSYPDQAYAQYQDAVSTGAVPSNSNSNPLASYNNNGYDSYFQPRGSFPCTLTVERYVAGVYTDSSLVSSGANNTWKVGVRFTATEPFIGLSPFLNNTPMSNAGLMGINNMSIVCNIDSTCKRLMGTAKTTITAGNVPPLALTAGSILPTCITGISLGFTPQGGVAIPAFSATRLLFNFQTLQPEQYSRLSSKNICGYSDYPRYLTSFNSSNIIETGKTMTLTSQNIQLNQVPSLLLIAVRVPMSDQGIANTSSFLEIENISVNFNSQSGLLASSTKQDLFQISKINGNNQSYYEWNGAVNNISTAGATQGNVSKVGGTGSLLVLNPALDFSMPSFLTGGSLGQFSLQFNITVRNQYGYNFSPEIICICKNDGLFVTSQGTSVIYTALLDKQTTLRTKEQAPMLDWNHHQRLVGGKLSNMALSALGKVGKYYRARKGDVAEAKEAFQGSGISGGGISGGGVSGGRHRLSRHLM